MVEKFYYINNVLHFKPQWQGYQVCTIYYPRLVPDQRLRDT